MDAIPVFSQVKSFVQWICRDAEGARQTQINFSRQCPVISQARSAVEAIRGDKQAARETQVEFGRFVSSLVNGIPVVGHVKGAVHYAMKDKDGGDAAMKAASHTTAVIVGGVGGVFVGGPVGSVLGGIGAGIAIDAIITGADSAINKKFKPYGVLYPLTDPTNPGKWCDAAGGIVLDGLTGKFAGEIAQIIRMNCAPKPGVAADSVFEKAVIPVRPATTSSLERDLITVCRKILDLFKLAKDILDAKKQKHGEKKEEVLPVTRDDAIKLLSVSYKHDSKTVTFLYEVKPALVKKLLGLVMA